MSTSGPQGRLLVASELRRLAVLADCDPRTIKRVYAGHTGARASIARARRILEQEGYLRRTVRSAAAGAGR